MTLIDKHRARNLTFKAGETVSISVSETGERALGKISSIQGVPKVKAEERSASVPLSKKVATVDVRTAFPGRLGELTGHEVVVNFSGNKGTTYSHKIVADSALGMWTYHLLPMAVDEPVPAYYMCSNRDCSWNKPRRAKLPLGECTRCGKGIVMRRD
jgi:hypothetical protein